MRKFWLLAFTPLLGCAAGSDHGGANGLGGGGGSSGSSGDGGSSSPLATGLSISEVAVFQGVKADIVKDGAQVTPNAAIVAGRRAMFRVYVTPGAGFTPHPINGVLELTTAGAGHKFTSTLSPSVASSDPDWNSTFDFDVDAASLGTDTTFLVRLEDPMATTGGDANAQFPATGMPATLGARSSGALKISLFPIHFTAGNAGTPATGATDIAAYQSVVMGMYPTSDVTITVQAPLDYGGPIPQANGANWGQLLNAMVQRRSNDPAPDVYYYAAFAPAPSFESFCGGGCVAGLSSIPQSPHDFGQKASIGLVYGGNGFDQHSSGITMAHEVGHGHGREHSPTVNGIQGCVQPSGIDPQYPYPQGDIGVWGFNNETARPFAPTAFFDLMGYCQQTWISDYTYQALFQWMTVDNGALFVEPGRPKVYRQIVDEGDGTITLGASFPVHGTVSGVEHTVVFEDHGATHTVTGHYYPYDHIPGGYLLVEEPPHFTAVRVPDFGSSPAFVR